MKEFQRAITLRILVVAVVLELLAFIAARQDWRLLTNFATVGLLICVLAIIAFLCIGTGHIRFRLITGIIIAAWIAFWIYVWFEFHFGPD